MAGNQNALGDLDRPRTALSAMASSLSSAAGWIATAARPDTVSATDGREAVKARANRVLWIISIAPASLLKPWSSAVDVALVALSAKVDAGAVKTMQRFSSGSNPTAPAVGIRAFACCDRGNGGKSRCHRLALVRALDSGMPSAEFPAPPYPPRRSATEIAIKVSSREHKGRGLRLLGGCGKPFRALAA